MSSCLFSSCRNGSSSDTPSGGRLKVSLPNWARCWTEIFADPFVVVLSRPICSSCTSLFVCLSNCLLVKCEGFFVLSPRYSVFTGVNVSLQVKQTGLFCCRRTTVVRTHTGCSPTRSVFVLKRRAGFVSTALCLHAGPSAAGPGALKDAGEDLNRIS